MIGAAVASGVSALGGMISQGIGARKARKAAEARARALRALAQSTYGDLEAPNATIADSALSHSYADQDAVNAQKTALAELYQLGHERGLTPQEQAVMNEINTGMRARIGSARESALADLRERGMGNSPAMLLAAELQGQSDASRDAYDQSLAANAMAQQRAMQSLANYGNLAGNIRGQSFQEQSTRDQARDMLNQFNSNMTANRFNQELNLRNSRYGAGAAAEGANYQAQMVPSQIATGVGGSLTNFGASMVPLAFGQQGKKRDDDDVNKALRYSGVT